MASLSVSSSSPARPTIAGVSEQISQLESNISMARESHPADMLAKKQQYVQANSTTLNGLNHLISATRAAIRRGSDSGIQDATPDALAKFENRLSLATRELTYIQNNIKCSEDIIRLNKDMDKLFDRELLFETREVDTPDAENIEQYIALTVELGKTRPLSTTKKSELREIGAQLNELSKGAEKFSPVNAQALRISQNIVLRLLTIPVSSTTPGTTSSAQAGSLSTQTRVQQPTKSLPAASASLATRLGDAQPARVPQTLKSLTTLQGHINKALRLPPETLAEGRALHWHANAARATLLNNTIQAGIPGATQEDLAQLEKLLSTASIGIEQIKATIKPVLENTRKNDNDRQIKEKIEELRSKISSPHQSNDLIQMPHVMTAKEVKGFRAQITELRKQKLSEENQTALTGLESLLARQPGYSENLAPLSNEEAELQMLNDALRRDQEDDLAPLGNEEAEVQFAPQAPTGNQEDNLGGIDNAVLQAVIRQSGGNQGGRSIEDDQLERALQASRGNQVDDDDVELLLALANSMETSEGKTSN